MQVPRRRAAPARRYLRAQNGPFWLPRLCSSALGMKRVRSYVPSALAAIKGAGPFLLACPFLPVVEDPPKRVTCCFDGLISMRSASQHYEHSDLVVSSSTGGYDLPTSVDIENNTSQHGSSCPRLSQVASWGKSTQDRHKKPHKLNMYTTEHGPPKRQKAVLLEIKVLLLQIQRSCKGSRKSCYTQPT